MVRTYGLMNSAGSHRNTIREEAWFKMLQDPFPDNLE